MELPKSNLEDVPASNSDFAKSESQLMIHSPESRSFRLIDLDAHRVVIKPLYNLPIYGYEVTHSCNGLLLLESTDIDMATGVHRCMVFNPVTGEYIILPESVHLAIHVKCAFSVSPNTHQFKVFRAFHRVFRQVSVSDPDPDSDLSSDCSMETDLFSDSDVDTVDPYISSDPDSSSDSGSHIDPYSDSDSDSDSNSSTDSMFSDEDRMVEFLEGGSESWEFHDDLPFSPSDIYSPCYLNESTHWLCVDVDVANLIVSFNFETREFGEILTPIPIGNDHMNARDDMSLVVLGGCLSIFDGYTKKWEFHIWVMKEYGVWESWSKDFVIDTTTWGVYGLHYHYEPVMCRGDGKVVMVCEDGYVSVFDLGMKLGRFLKWQAAGVSFEAMALTPSVMSLRDAMSGSNMDVQNVA